MIAGLIRARIDGRDHRFTTGDECVVARGIPHTWWNAGPTEARVLVEYRPASRMETFLETIYGLVQDGKTNDKGVPNLMQRAVFARAYFDVCHLARPPLAVQKALFGLLSPLGRLLGYRADYPYPYESGRRLPAPDSTTYLHSSTQPRRYYP